MMLKEAVKAMVTICAMSLGLVCTSFQAWDLPDSDMNVDLCKLGHQFAWPEVKDLATY